MIALTIVGLLAIVMQVATAQDERSAKDDCIIDLNLDKEKIESFLGKFPEIFPEDDTEFNEFLNCVCRKGGYLNKDGEIDYSGVIKLAATSPRTRYGVDSSEVVGMQIATESVENCKSKPPGSTPGQIVAQFQNCVTRRIVELLKPSHK